MTINISPFNNRYINFKTGNDKKVEGNISVKAQNPISRKGEAANLTKATFVAGLALGGRLLWEILKDGDFLIEDIAKVAKRTVEQNKKNVSSGKKFLLFVGTFAAFLAAFVSGVAILKTIYNVPKIAYDSKVNAFKKTQEMDVYSSANEAEKSLYEELDNKAKESTPEEKEALKEQYLKLRNAKNQVPDFVELK